MGGKRPNGWAESARSVVLDRLVCEGQVLGEAISFVGPRPIHFVLTVKVLL